MRGWQPFFPTVLILILANVYAGTTHIYSGHMNTAVCMSQAVHYPGASVVGGTGGVPADQRIGLVAQV